MDIKVRKLEEMLLDARSKVEDIDPLSIIGKEDQYTIIDVREPGEVQESGMISGAHNIPRGLLEFQLYHFQTSMSDLLPMQNFVS